MSSTGSPMVADNWSIDPKQLRTEFDKPRFSIKLCQPLKTLNPNDKLIINDWLIKFRAAAGDICSTAFNDPVLRSDDELGVGELIEHD